MTVNLQKDISKIFNLHHYLAHNHSLYVLKQNSQMSSLEPKRDNREQKRVSERERERGDRKRERG